MTLEKTREVFAPIWYEAVNIMEVLEKPQNAVVINVLGMRLLELGKKIGALKIPAEHAKVVRDEVIFARMRQRYAHDLERLNEISKMEKQQQGETP